MGTRKGAIVGQPRSTAVRDAAVPAILLTVFAVRSAGAVTDPDTFWHLATGRQLTQDWAFAGPDPLSPFTNGTWVRHQWLPDLLFFGSQHLGGPALLAWLLPLMTVVTMGVVYAVLRSRTGALLAGVLTGLAFIAASGSISLRPQVLSFAFTAVVAGAWLRAPTSERVPWLVVPITWVWACSHGLWVLAPAIGLLAVVGSLIDRAPRPFVVRQLVVAVASLAVGALTPVGPRLLLAPLQVSGVTQYIQEWQPPPLLSLPVLAASALILLPAAVWVRERPVGPAVEALLLLACVPGVLSARRTVGVAAVVAAVVAAQALQRVMPMPRDRVRRSEVFAAVTASVVALGLAWLAIPRPETVRGFPGGMDEVLAARPAGAVVCNDYDVGGWLLWQHPQLIPVIDGRTELFTVQHIREHLAFVAARPGWEEYAARSGCELALVRTTSPVAGTLGDAAGWSRIVADDNWSLFGRSHA